MQNIPRQPNFYDCGVFSLKYADYLSQGLPLGFTAEHMPYFRRRMVLEILDQRIA